jgi:phosphoglycolate phosphatase
MSRPHGVAFDLDGTLIDSRLDIAAACNHVLASAGRATLDPAVIATFVGDGMTHLVARAFQLPMDSPELPGLVERFAAYYAAHPVEHTRWMPGALEALDALAPLPLAIVTNKARAVTLRVLEGLVAGGRFAFVSAGGDGPLKPRPEPVLAVARALGVEVGALWVVGDADQDILSARAAGAFAVAVRGGFADDARLEAAAPDVTLASLHELPELVRRSSL